MPKHLWDSSLALAVALASISACSPHAGTAAQGIGDARPIGASLAPDTWKVGCQGDQINAYGEKTSSEKCYAIATYVANTEHGSPIGAQTIFEVDAAGTRLVAAKDFDNRLCSTIPIMIAVDGRRIDGLPMQQRIEAVISGFRLTRQADRGWPHCNLYNETTTLSGARSAYNDMLKMWATRRAGN